MAWQTSVGGGARAEFEEFGIPGWVRKSMNSQKMGRHDKFKNC